MKILPADPADAEGLRDVHVATWRATYGDHAAEGWYRARLAAHSTRDWREVLRAQAARGGRVLTARRDGEVVGLCQFGPTEDRDHDPERVGQVQRLYVHPEHQRTGVGRSLLASSVERLRATGAREATLWALEADERARAFYEHLGWRPDGTRVDHPPIDLRYRLPLA